MTESFVKLICPVTGQVTYMSMRPAPVALRSFGVHEFAIWNEDCIEKVFFSVQGETLVSAVKFLVQGMGGAKS